MSKQRSRTIRARADAAHALERVGELFDAGSEDILAELLQNARRAGATRVDVDTERNDAGRTAVRVRDDGCGIANPSVVLSFGESGWSGNTRARERAAGMGLYALAQGGCTIRSKTTGDAHGWRVALDTAAFTGGRDAEVVRDQAIAWEQGTEVAFETDHSARQIALQLALAARHAPIEVRVDGRTLEREDHLGGCMHVEMWEGVRIGVYEGPAWSRDETLNFYGRKVRVEIAKVSEFEGRTWHAAVDVIACPDLQLVLPARKEVIEGAFLKRLRAQARAVVYRAIAQHARDAQLPRAAYDEGRALAAAVPAPQAKLPAWEPRERASMGREATEKKVVGANTLVMSHDIECEDRFVIERALARAPQPMEAVEPGPFEGFGWYDEAAKMRSMEILVERGETAWRVMAERAKVRWNERVDVPEALKRPEKITLLIETERAKGRQATLALEADAVLAGNCEGGIESAGLVVAQGFDGNAHELVEMMGKALFDPGDEVSGDAWEVLQERFEEEAYAHVTRMLYTEDEALARTIGETFENQVSALCPVEKRITIEVLAGRTRVDVRDAHAAVG